MTRNIYLEDIPLQEALDILFSLGNLQLLPAEQVALADSAGRITAEPVWAQLSAPHYHASAMDGYAVDAKVTDGATETRPVTLNLDQEAFAVNTGDPMPPDTNAVIMIEHTELQEPHQIIIRSSVAPRQHVRLMGEDMVATELVLPANHHIRPVDIGALAGSGHDRVAVRRKPQVYIIPTGSELVTISESPSPGQIIEYNSLVLRAQVEEIGGHATVGPLTPDQPDAVEKAVQAALEQKPDLILLLSGSSAGSKDFTAQVIRNLGNLHVHGVAIRPGHPVILGEIEQVPVIGVPGYPVSAALTGEIFIQSLLAKWSGIPSPHELRPRVEAVSTRKIVSPTGDDDFIRVTLASVGDHLQATPLNRGAGVITSMVRADGLAHIPRFSEGVNRGDRLSVRLYQPLHVIERTILAMGSHDPMLDLLAQYVAVHYAPARLVSSNVGSLGGLIALKRGEAHLAGTHLLDPDTGEYNIRFVHQYLDPTSVKMFTFAHREQGFIVHRGNPHDVQDVTDLMRVRFVNRQKGSGTRQLLDYQLAQHGLSGDEITGYYHEEFTHLAVAAAVASGVADTGIGVRRAAIALDLDFVPIGWERYDLVIPDIFLEQANPVLQLLNDKAFKQRLAAQPGYDVSHTGAQITL